MFRTSPPIFLRPLRHFPLHRPYSSSSSSAVTPLDLRSRPLRIAIVGSGPAGFYSASRLLSLPGTENLRVNMFEMLPVPFGLVRFGVAPDHPEVKNCIHKFNETAKDPRFRFYGNVQIGGPSSQSQSQSQSQSLSGSGSNLIPHPSPSPLAINLPLTKLRSTHDIILLTYGSTLNRTLNVPGESTLSNVISAREFVQWYNGHPESSSPSSPSGSSPKFDLSDKEKVTIVGHGNVALDVARILLKPFDSSGGGLGLGGTDISSEALEMLSRSKVREVSLVGRRGPLQFAGTTKELREMMDIRGLGFEVDGELVDEAWEALERFKVDGRRAIAGAGAGSGSGLAGSPGKERMMRRLLDLMRKGPRNPKADAGGDGVGEKVWRLEFLKSPIGFSPDPRPDVDAFPSTTTTKTTTTSETITSPSPVRSMIYQNNVLSPSSGPSPSIFEARALPTGVRGSMETDMVFTSVGYRGVGIPGVPFDEGSGVVRNLDGRVVDEDGMVIPGLYTSGWLSRGPNGVIANTMYDAFSTAEVIASDVSSSSVPTSTSTSEGPSDPSDQERLSASEMDDVLERELRGGGGGRVVRWEDWERIDEVERERGRQAGKEREKIVRVEEMLGVLDR